MINRITKFVLNMQFIFKPTYWIMNERYNKKLDEKINALLDKYDFTNINTCTAYLGDVEIWIENQPYSCMMPSEYQGKLKYRPSRLTIQKGIRKLKKKVDNEYENYLDSLIK